MSAPGPEQPDRTIDPALPETRQHILLRWLPLIAVIAVGVVLAFLAAPYLSLSEVVRRHGAMSDYVSAHLFSALAIYFAAYVAIVVFSVPGGSFVTIAGGLVFGGVVGGLTTTVAATVGAVGVYYIAKTALADWVTRRIATLGSRARRFIDGLRDNAFYVVVVLRLVPIVPFWASNAIPALFGVRIDIFIVATLIGLLPWTVSFAFFGSALNEVIIAQELANPGCAEAGTCSLDFSALQTGPLLIGLAIALVALTPVAAHWWLTRRARTGAGTGEV